MKRKVALLAIVTILSATSVFADEGKPEPKPITKIMLARLGWIQSIAKAQAYSNFEGLAKDAADLAAQAKKVGEAASAPFPKEMNLAVSESASGLADAAGKKDGVGTAAKLGEILGKCYTCHSKVRDKR